MKNKSLAILVSMSAVISAQAQNASLSGLIDQSIDHLTNVHSKQGGLNRMPGLTGSSPSRLEFRGTEDIGGGLEAISVLKQGFGLDTGTLNQGGRILGRQSSVGLSNLTGSAAMGRQYSMLYWSQLDTDVLRLNVYGISSPDSYVPNARKADSLAYKETFGGWNFGASYSFGQDSVTAGPLPSRTNCPGEGLLDNKACRQYRPWSSTIEAIGGASIGVEEIVGGPGAFAGLTNSNLKDRRVAAGSWFKYENLERGAGLITCHNEASVTTPRSDLWYVGGTYAITPLSNIDARISKLDYLRSTNKATLSAMRGTYMLSKRTHLYTTIGQMPNDGSLALSVSSAAGGGVPAAETSQTGLATGVRHVS